MNDSEERIERILKRYRPVGPPAELRVRVLTTSPTGPAGGRPWALGWWSAVAASILLSFGLNRGAESVNRQTATMLGVGQVRWTPEAEEMARMLDGDGHGRYYVALCLAAGDFVDRSQSTLGSSFSIGGIP